MDVPQREDAIREEEDANIVAAFDYFSSTSSWELAGQLTAVDLVMFGRICKEDIIGAEDSEQVRSIGRVWQARCRSIINALRAKESNEKYTKDLAMALYQRNNFHTLAAVVCGLDSLGKSIPSEFAFLLDNTQNYRAYRMQLDFLQDTNGPQWYFLPWVYPNRKVTLVNPLLRGPIVQRFLSAYSGYDQIVFDHSVAVLGSENAGKTSIIYKAVFGPPGKRYLSEKYLSNTSSPYYRVLRSNNYNFRLSLLDTCVFNEKFRPEPLIPRTEGFILVYDPSIRESFEFAQTMINLIENRGGLTPPPILLIANKRWSMYNWIKSRSELEANGRILAKRHRSCIFVSCNVRVMHPETLREAIVDMLQPLRR